MAAMMSQSTRPPGHRGHDSGAAGHPGGNDFPGKRDGKKSPEDSEDGIYMDLQVLYSDHGDLYGYIYNIEIDKTDNCD